MIFLLLGTLLGTLGLISCLSKSNFLAWLMGAQLMFLAMTLLFATSGLLVQQPLEGMIFAFFTLLASLVFVLVGGTLGLHLYQLRKNLLIATLKELKK